MRMLLQPRFLNGQFGDPALFIKAANERSAILIDCGDLSRFTTRQLLQVTHLFLSHCHIDHFFGFDHFLRVHVGSEKSVTIFGPLETSKRVGGKLQGYTWNLIHDQNLNFTVVDLDPVRKRKYITHFHAKNRFKPSKMKTESWDPKTPVYDAEVYHVNSAMLDHRTPSMAYSIEEKLTIAVNAAVLKEMALKPGPWINTLKKWFLFSRKKSLTLEVPLKEGGIKKFKASELAEKLLIPRQRHKMVYATDGAAHKKNYKALLSLARNADLFFSETCFLKADQILADETKHFTAAFMGRLANQANVKKLAPFHFSKRYLGKPHQVLEEIASYFKGEIIALAALPRQPKFQEDMTL